MCGISGTIRHGGEGSELVQSLLRLQHRRGPDHSEWKERNGGSLHFTFGHNRLAILDLDPRSNQPFIDNITNQLLVFNGEIYNYVELRNELESLGHGFHTTSDTEVLLKAYHQWEFAAFEKFNGMFAFALHDPLRQRTLLVRDRFGVKPLYYHMHDGQLTWASSASALARSVKAPLNLPYLAVGVRHDLFEGLTLETAFQGVMAVPPGHCMVYENQQLRVQPYYDLKQRVESLAERLCAQSLDENVTELKQLLANAVDLRLRADVPVTLSLSGGLDSGLCAAYIREVRSAPFTAYTFAGLDWSGSEAGLALLTGRKLGIDVDFVKPQKFEDLFNATMEAQGAPFADPSVLAQNAVFGGIHAAKYKVSIGGQGADEGYAGYRKFQLTALNELRQRGKFVELFKQGAGTAWTLARELNSPNSYVSRFIKSRRSTEPPFFNSKLCPTPPQAVGLGAQTLRARQILDVQRMGLPTLLRYEDSNSMYHSIESRMPFLDYRVMEFGMALPLEHKVRGGFGKFILRKLAERHLPEQIVWDRNKRAFSLHPSMWLEKGLGRKIYDEVQAHREFLFPLLDASVHQEVRNPGFFLQRKNFTKMVTLIYMIRQRSEA